MTSEIEYGFWDNMFDTWNPLGSASDVGFVDVEWSCKPTSKAGDGLKPVKYLHGRIYYPTPKDARRLFCGSSSWLPGLWYAYGALPSDAHRYYVFVLLSILQGWQSSCFSGVQRAFWTSFCNTCCLYSSMPLEACRRFEYTTVRRFWDQRVLSFLSWCLVMDLLVIDPCMP